MLWGIGALTAMEALAGCNDDGGDDDDDDGGDDEMEDRTGESDGANAASPSDRR